MTTLQDVSKGEMLSLLRERDGDACVYPGCNRRLEFFGDEGFVEGGKWNATLDHKYPQALARKMGWTEAEIQHIDNLQLMHRQCNAKKGSRLYNENGQLEEPKRRQFRYRRDKRANRPAVCQSCSSGRALSVGETCTVCGSGPQPAVFPTMYKRKPSECSHSGLESCWACIIGIVTREPASSQVFDTEYLDGEEWPDE